MDSVDSKHISVIIDRSVVVIAVVAIILVCWWLYSLVLLLVATVKLGTRWCKRYDIVLLQDEG